MPWYGESMVFVLTNILTNIKSQRVGFGAIRMEPENINTVHQMNQELRAKKSAFLWLPTSEAADANMTPRRGPSVLRLLSQ